MPTDRIPPAEAQAAAELPDLAAAGAPRWSKRLTRPERNWVLYDVGNSALALLSTAVVPIYLNSLLEAAGRTDVVTSFGYAQTVASLVVAVLMPILGSLADFQGKKVKFFLGFFLTGLVCCFGMALPLGWLAFLVVYVLATIGLNSSMTFYDAMLVDVTTDERMDDVSSRGTRGATWAPPSPSSSAWPSSWAARPSASPPSSPPGCPS